jgi:hypothetical protein
MRVSAPHHAGRTNLESHRSRAAAWMALIVLVAVAAAVGAQASPRIVFVTSARGTGDLGSWPQSGIATGIAAGDNICQSLASAAGLPDTASYRAWLSNATDDAWCRTLGLAGKKPNCGFPSPPGLGAGPWVRTDGFPFADDLESLLDPVARVFAPPVLDENGLPVPHTEGVWTGTAPSGVAVSSHCAGWSVGDNTSGGRRGAATATSGTWTSKLNVTCNAELRLLCLQAGASGSLPSRYAGGRFAFVTSVTGNGDLGGWPEVTEGETGMTAGHAICRRIAELGGLSFADTYKAWIRDTSSGGTGNFVNDGPFIRLDGVPIAASLSGLLAARRFTSVNLDELGAYHQADRAWTGLRLEGGSKSCSDWLDGTASSQGTWGEVNESSRAWTGATVTGDDCDQHRHLYCFSDAPGNLLFADGFDSGSTWLWSAALGLP